MQQRCGVNKFNRGGEPILARARIIEQRTGREREHRAHPLSTACNQMARQFWDQRNLRLHPIKNHGVDLIHAGGHKRDHGIERRGCGI